MATNWPVEQPMDSHPGAATPRVASASYGTGLADAMWADQRVSPQRLAKWVAFVIVGTIVTAGLAAFLYELVRYRERPL